MSPKVSAARLEQVRVDVLAEQHDLVRLLGWPAQSGRTWRRGSGTWPAHGPASPKRRSVEKEVEVRRGALGCRRRRDASVRGCERTALDPTLAPLADLGDELDVAHELVVDEVVAAVDRPEEIRPLAIDLVGEPFARCLVRFREGLFEPRLEVLERRERLSRASSS